LAHFRLSVGDCSVCLCMLWWCHISRNTHSYIYIYFKRCIKIINVIT